MDDEATTPAERGANAATPLQLRLRGWMDVLKRVWANSGTHHVGLIAAGVAFFSFLSFVPLLGALVMSYGILADPSAVARHMALVIEIMPADAASLVNEQLLELTRTAAEQKGMALAVALGLSIFSARSAAGAIIEALNIIYEEEDHRGFVRTTLISGALVIGAVLIGIAGLTAIAILGYAGQLLGRAPLVAMVFRALVWLAAAALCCFTLGAMYRFAPNRADARWQWLSVGAVIGTVLWLLATLAFATYVANFGHYDVTYGSLGAVVVLLLWLHLSAYSVLIGAMINAEAERQTARDSTTGPERPMGSRGATVADTSAALARGAAAPAD